MVVLHFELGIFIMEVTASLLLVSQTMGYIVRGFRLIVQAPTFRASSMLLQLSLLPLVLGRAALPHSRSMVYVPPIWATLDCSACSPGDLVSILDMMNETKKIVKKRFPTPGYSGVVTFFHTLLAGRT